jgi:pimeloyl-ACP methyl ester carboxylesterase
MSSAGIDSAHIAGHSMGTIVCQHLAARHPDKVKSLALVGPLAAPPDPARAAVRDRAAKARKEGMAGVADAVVQAGTSALTRSARPEAAAFVRELLMRQDPEGYALTCEALSAAQPADLANVHCPALLITGSEDVVAPPLAVRLLASRLTSSRVIIFNGCGHWTTIERPLEVTEALLNFYLGKP